MSPTPAPAPGAAPGTAREPRVLHVNDCASTTAQLLARAHEDGLPWSYLPLAGEGRSFAGPLAGPARAAAGVRWLAELALRTSSTDLRHVHYGSVVQHTRLVPQRYVLHLHGTDVRTQQYDPRWTALIRGGIARAEHVYFSTPDLAEHVLPHRADAELFPVPIACDALPSWAPAERPTVLFASRWEQVKGLDAQLAAARALRAALPDDVRLVGLAWGDGAPAAVRAGVELVGRLDRAAYLRLLASAAVVVGQASGMLAASELEAVGIGVPVVSVLDPAWYPERDPAERPAVLLGASAAGGGPGGADGAAGGRADLVVDAVRTVLDDPAGVSRALDGPAWLRRHHDVGHGVARLRGRYRELTR